ncbi:hypothetical protein AWZ03_009544 [Drosophila navojoa]|uniref:Uncharacterized protein n=1 Tax=Drosophila navojoa TaxID=7232 RepID=A0A484B8B3_DRONA|nr:actin cytoskeleton-regulatory complex protein pan1 [Drosophila navojoa]TDG44055.1 hypothetical protein AWZ03_009544 [Drosophila navojoa]
MSHLQHQQEPQQQPPERSGHSHQGIMDLRNLCQRLDVENLKAKLTSLPQLKLPKSLPKLRAARHLFRGSRANSSGKEAPAATAAELQSEASGMGMGMGMAQAQFINRTPQRISTISSLMHEHEHEHDQVAPQHLQPSAGGTYRSAGSLDDDYYAPYGAAARVSRPISPVKVPAPGDAAMPTPTLRNSGSNTLTQRLQRGYKSLSELRLKHLFAKQTVVRRDGIEVDRYVEQYEAERRVEQMAQARRDRQIADNYDIHISTLPITRENTLKAQQQQQQQALPQHRRSVAEHSGDESGMEEAIPQQQQVPPVPRKKTGIAATRFARVRQPPLPMPLEDQAEEQQPQKPKQPQAVRQAVRQNLKRLRKSIKRVQRPAARPTADDSDSDEEQQQQQQQQQQQRKSKTRSSTGDTLRARLRRFASSEQLQQRWRRSFKSNSDSQEPAAQQPSGAAFGFVGMGAHLERTMTKLNEKMQQLKFFQRSGADRAEAGNKPNTVGREPVEIDDEELEATYHHTDSSDSEDSGQDVCADDAYGQMEVEPQPDASPTALVKRQTLTSLQASASTAWSSESLEEDATVEQQLAAAASDYPRVLIHQQHTDAYESTLILAVAATPPPVPSPAALEKHQWVSNQQIIADFRAQQMSSPSAWPAPALYKPKSIDIFEGDGGAAAAFADFDEALRNAPMLRISAGSSCDSGEDADDSSSRVTRIRLQTPQIGNSCESLMEQQPLEDDDEVPNKTEAMDVDADADADTNVDANANVNVNANAHADQDEDLARLVERPPSESPPPPPLPQRRPPPPSTVAPIYDAVPPPLPISKPPPPPMQAAPLAPAPPVVAPSTIGNLPQRSASTTRPSKPLVKTSSLRLTYNEQMHPADVGKVNKLISRFGGRPRLCARRMHSEELTTCSDADDEPEPDPEPEPEPQLKSPLQPKADKQQQLQQQQTPTNAKPSAIPNIVTTQPSNNNNNNNNDSAKTKTEQQLSLDRQNSNCSRSEYGSPLAYPLSNSRRRSSTPTVASTLNANGSALALAPQSQSQRAQAQARRSRRSMTRDDENFYSFDSDEENSYYSISPSSSSRYVVEI